MTESTQTTQWQLGGDSATAYENYLVPAIFREGARQLVEYAELTSGKRVLDVGCGTGIVARTAAERVGPTGAVAGVDINPQMLEIARSASAGTEPSIDWREGAAEQLPMARSSFDAVLSQQAFQFFNDRITALREMRRVLAPGGRAIIGVLRSIEYNHTYQPVVDAFTRHGGSELGTMMQAPFQDWSIDELREMLQQSGFEDASIGIDVVPARFPSIPDFLHHELSSSPLGEVVATMSEETRQAIVRDVQSGLQGYLDDHGLMHPLQTYIIVAWG